MQKVSRILAGFSLAILLAGNAAFLQGLAWCGMAVSFSRQVSVSTAVQWTFDGRHPCSLCQMARKVASETSSPVAHRRIAHWDLLQPTETRVELPPTSPASPQFAIVSPPESRREPPLLPPPRLA